MKESSQLTVAGAGCLQGSADDLGELVAVRAYCQPGAPAGGKVRRGDRLCSGLPCVAKMAADVADKINADSPLNEAPHPVAALEAILVPTAGDGLQGQVGQRL